MRGTCCGVLPSASASAGRESIALGLGRTYGEVTARQAGGSAEAATRTRRASATAMLFFFPIVVAIERKEARGQSGLVESYDGWVGTRGYIGGRLCWLCIARRGRRDATLFLEYGVHNNGGPPWIDFVFQVGNL